MRLLRKYWWFVAIAAVTFIGVILGSVYKLDWITNGLTYAGILTSVAGFIVAIDQVKDLETQTAEIKTAVETRRDEIKVILNHGNLGHLIEMIKNVQQQLNPERIRIAEVHLNYIKDDLVRIHQDCLRHEGFPEEHLKGIETLKSQIENGLSQIFEFDGQFQQKPKEKGINKVALYNSLNKGLTVLVAIETYLRQTKL